MSFVNQKPDLDPIAAEMDRVVAVPRYMLVSPTVFNHLKAMGGLKPKAPVLRRTK